MFVNDETVSLTDNAGDGTGSGVQSVSYSYCTDDGAGGCAGSTTLIGSSSNSGGNFAVNWNTPLPSDATYRITAVATDNLGTAGNTSSATLVAVDKTPPDGLAADRERTLVMRVRPEPQHQTSRRGIAQPFVTVRWRLLVAGSARCSPCLASPRVRGQ